MIHAGEIAVCVSGLAREGYKEAIEIAQKVFPFKFFYMQWKGYPEPEVPDCEYFNEPQYDYHNLTDTQYKPDCDIWRRYASHKQAKIFRKPGAWEKTKHNSKQTLAHYWLTNTIPEQYKTIIKLRYDTLMSTKVDFMPLLEQAQQGKVVGIWASTEVDNPLQIHKYKDCKRCPGPFLWDHLIFHPREKLKNVEKLFHEKNLLGAEWGWHQVLCHQWEEDNNYINAIGGNILTAHRVKK